MSRKSLYTKKTAGNPAASYASLVIKLQTQGISSVSVCCLHSSHYLFRSDDDWHIVQGVAFCACCFCNCHQLLVSYVSQTQLLEGYRQIHVDAPVDDILQFFGVDVLDRKSVV